LSHDGEAIMSKSNDVSTLNHRPLADSELDAVSGGSIPVHRTSQAIVDSLQEACQAWNDCLKVYGYPRQA
jgi:hypothetical protein